MTKTVGSPAVVLEVISSQTNPCYVVANLSAEDVIRIRNYADFIAGEVDSNFIDISFGRTTWSSVSIFSFGIENLENQEFMAEIIGGAIEAATTIRVFKDGFKLHGSTDFWNATSSHFSLDLLDSIEPSLLDR